MSLDPIGYENGNVIGGRYRIVGLIGQGGMGAVYAAEDLRLQESCVPLRSIRFKQLMRCTAQRRLVC